MVDYVDEGRKIGTVLNLRGTFSGPKLLFQGEN
jgi:hypothetical protein